MDNTTTVEEVGRHDPEAANLISRHLWPRHRATMVTKLRQNEGVLRVKDNSDGASRGLRGDGPKCQQRHSSILGSVGGTYGPIIMVQWHHTHTALRM